MVTATAAMMTRPAISARSVEDRSTCERSIIGWSPWSSINVSVLYPHLGHREVQGRGRKKKPCDRQGRIGQCPRSPTKRKLAPWGWKGLKLDGSDGFCLVAFAALTDLEFDLLAFFE